MKITYSWMKELTPVAVDPAELARRLTLAGLEVESMAPVAPPFSEVVVGEVLECSRHPEAQKLTVCRVTSDGNDRLQIICGAANVRAGLRVAVARIGARLPQNARIERASLRGLDSHGMLCSARELGLGEEHDGILELPAELAVGRDLRAALDLDDVVMEVNATPNRGDCMSVFGIARDYAAAQDRRYLKAQVGAIAPVHTGVFPVTIEPGAGCPVFASRVIRGLRAGGVSPAWLKERLRRVGLNAISPIVDVTNYVMIELGQPLHAYDLGRLRKGIVVRAAHAGERVTLLDDREYGLGADCLVIADAAGTVGLAGIMGGKRTSIDESTTEVLLESAHFTPSAVAGRARRLGLFTDAAQRFERGVDPTLPQIALERATSLLLQIAGGEPGPVQITRSSIGPDRLPEWVSLRRERLTRLLGTTVPDEDTRSVLFAIAENVEPQTDGWRIQPPAHRFDLRIEADLIEEVARLRGFDRIPELPALVPQLPGLDTETRVSVERLALAMADNGYREAITYSFVDPQVQRLLFPDAPALALANPIASDLSEMRVSLWPGLMLACRNNLRRQQSRIRLFEIGNRFESERQALREIETLSGVATGARWPEQWGSAREPLDFYDVKADVESVLALTGAEAEFSFEPSTLACLRPGRAACVLRNGRTVGHVGEVHPRVIKALGLAGGIFVFDLELSKAFASKVIKINKLSRFPSVRRDLAVVIDESVPLAVLRENVTVSASGLLSELRVFDVYRGAGIESGRKSIALGLILQDSYRTLTDVDADAVVASVVARLRDVLSAAIRE